MQHLFNCSYGHLENEQLQWCFACEQWIENTESTCEGPHDSCHACGRPFDNDATGEK